MRRPHQPCRVTTPRSKTSRTRGQARAGTGGIDSAQFPHAASHPADIPSVYVAPAPILNGLVLAAAILLVSLEARACPVDLRCGVVQTSAVPDRLNRHDLSDEEWERLRVFLPCGPQQRGGRRADHRTVINGVFFRARAGCPWRDLPEGFGN
jgi:Putative transposase of IS4/5 family (DUF4096)